MEVVNFKSFDGTKLYVEKHYIANAKATVVLVHGLSEHAGRYHHIAQFLNENGYNAITLDNRGNGRSGGNKGDVNSFHDLLDDTHEVIKLARLDGAQKVFLLGHSLGGFIVNCYGAKYNDVDGIISSGAVGVYLKQVRPFLVIPFKPFKNMNVKNGLQTVLSHDPKISYDYERDPLVNKTNKVNLFGECFIRGVRYLRKNYQRLTVPILYLHGKDDKIVPYKSSVYLYNHVGSQDKKLVVFEGFYHEVFNEIGKEKAFAALLEFLNARS